MESWLLNSQRFSCDGSLIKGTDESVPLSRAYQLCFPRCLFHVYQLRPKVSPSCVSYRDTTKPPEQTGKRTRSAARDTTHTHTHTPHTHHTHTTHTHICTCKSRYCVLILYLCSRVVSSYEWCRKLAAINVSHWYYSFGIAVSTFAEQILRRFMFNKSFVKISCKIHNIDVVK